MSKMYNVAVAGATGAVGVEMVKTLEKRNFPAIYVQAKKHAQLCEPSPSSGVSQRQRSCAKGQRG